MNDLKMLNEKYGMTVVANLHSIELAQQFGERVIGIRAGQVVYDGKMKDTPKSVFTDIYNGGDGSEEAEYIAKYAVVYQDEYYVSLRLTESIWPLETFPMSTRACFTFDVRTGELLELTDLYEGSPEEVAEQIAQVIQDYGYGRYLNNDTYPTASDGFILAASDAEEDRYYSQLAQKKGQPLYYWHLADSMNDVRIPLPVTLPEFAGNENPAE